MFILILLVLIVLGSALLFSNLMLHAHRQPVVHTPSEYGMSYEDVTFASTDGLEMKGWFVPAGAVKDRVIVMTHPFPFNRHGFLAKNQGFPPLSRVDVDLLRTAHALHAAGYPVLLFDFRNHGESAAGLTGVGLNEYQDLLGALRTVRSRPDLENPRIGLVNFCMGANAGIIALSKGAGEVDNVRFLAAIQPVSAEVFILSYLRAVYTPLSVFLAPLVDSINRLRGGYAMREMTPIPYAKDIRVPFLLVQAPGDRWTQRSDTQAIFDAAVHAPVKELWWLEEVTHRFKAYNYVGEHPQRLLDFIAAHF